MTAPDLIGVVTLRQHELGETNTAFAKRLGVSRQAWDQIRTRQARPGRKILRGIIRAFPDLTAEVLRFLLTSDVTGVA